MFIVQNLSIPCTNPPCSILNNFSAFIVQNLSVYWTIYQHWIIYQHSMYNISIYCTHFQCSFCTHPHRLWGLGATRTWTGLHSCRTDWLSSVDWAVWDLNLVILAHSLMRTRLISTVLDSGMERNCIKTNLRFLCRMGQTTTKQHI